MKQKLALSCALIHRPPVLILDEPTTGVDAVSRQEFWQMLKALKPHGITILVSTPYMDEAGLCDRIALMQNGEILTTDTPKKITENYPRKLFETKSDNNYHLLLQLRENPAVYSAYSFGESLHVTLKDSAVVPGVPLTEITPSIEDCFMELLTSKSLKTLPLY
jgi:ABC-type multidrug transport system ATPase subunit